MPRYPTRVDELSRSNIKSLTQILRVESTGRRREDRRIRQMITRLPCHLRSSTLMNMIRSSSASAVLCPTHKNLNRQVIRHAFSLLQREVTLHLRRLEKYPEMVGPEEAMILHYVRAIQAMWTAPSAEVTSSQGTWAFQNNKCEACMLAQVGSNPRALRDLRTMLLSRSQTGREQSPPQLLRFVDEWINQHEDMKSYIFYQSGEQAYAMKKAREYAVQAKYQTRGRQIEQESWAPDDFSTSDPGHSRVPNEHKGTGHKLHDSRRDRKPAGSRPEPSFCSKNSTMDFENEIIDAYIVPTTHEGLTLEQQLGAMNVTLWPGDNSCSVSAKPTAVSTSVRTASWNTVSDDSHHSYDNSHRSDVFMNQHDEVQGSSPQYGEFHLSPTRPPEDKENGSLLDEYCIFVTYDGYSGSRPTSEFTDCTPPTTSRLTLPAEITWSCLYSADCKP